MKILVQVFSFLIFLSLTANTHAQENVSLLKESVQQWNKWREKNPGAISDFRGAILRGANLQGANLFMSDLRGASLQGANLRFANLHNANLQKTDLQDTNLQNSSFRGAKNLSCNQVNSVKSLDQDTKFPNYLEVKITGENQWTCKELKEKIEKQE